MSRREEILNEIAEIDSQINQIDSGSDLNIPIQSIPNQGMPVNDAPPNEQNMIPVDFNSKQVAIEDELSQARQDHLQMQNDLPKIAEKNERGIFQKISDVFTGNDRETYETINLPSLYESGILMRLPVHQVALLGTMGTLTNDPEEFAQIITTSDPEGEMHYRKDNKGNVILQDLRTGDEAVVDKPGLDSYNLTQVGAQGMLYGVNPVKGSGPLVKEGLKQAILHGGKNILKNAAKDTAIASGVEGAQAAMGGEINGGEIGLATLGGAAFPAIEEGVALAKNFRRAGPNPSASPEAMQKINQVNQESDFIKGYGVEPLTNYIPSVKPESPYIQQALNATNYIPFAGTGGMNKRAQAVRQKQVDDYVTRKGEANYDQMFSSLKDKTSRITQAAGERLNEITKKMEGVDVDINGLYKEMAQIMLNSAKNTKDEVQKTADKQTLEKMQLFLNDFVMDSSFKNVKDLRTNFRETILDGAESKTPKIEKAINQAYNTMSKYLGDSVESQLGNKELVRWEKANEFWGKGKTEYQLSVLKKIFDKGDVLPTDMEKVLLKGNPNKTDIRNLQILFKNLGPSGRENVRKSYIEWAAEKATDEKTGILNVNDFKDFLASKKKLTDIFFRDSVHGKHKTELKSLLKFLDMTESAQIDPLVQSLAETRNQILPVGGLVGLGIGIQAGQIPTILSALSAVGMAGKALQSPVVRTKIMELGTMRRGSTRFEKKMEEVRQALQNVYQATVNVDESRNGANSQLGRLDFVN